MIKNSKQAGITKAKLEELKKDLATFEQTQQDKLHPVRYELRLKSFQGLIAELEQQLEVYQKLTRGAVNELGGCPLPGLAEILIGTRLAKDMSQKELADKLGIQEQQVQRYEQDDYAKASWSRILEVYRALELSINLEKFRILRETPAVNAITSKKSASRRWKVPPQIARESVEKAKNHTRTNHSLFQQL